MHVNYTVQTILENKQRGLKQKHSDLTRIPEDDDSAGNRQGVESTRGRGGRGIGDRGRGDRGGRGRGDRARRGRGDRGRRGRGDRGGINSSENSHSIIDSRRERSDGGKVTMASK